MPSSEDRRRYTSQRTTHRKHQTKRSPHLQQTQHPRSSAARAQKRTRTQTPGNSPLSGRRFQRLIPRHSASKTCTRATRAFTTWCSRAAPHPHHQALVQPSGLPRGRLCQHHQLHPKATQPSTATAGAAAEVLRSAKRGSLTTTCAQQSRPRLLHQRHCLCVHSLLLVDIAAVQKGPSVSPRYLRSGSVLQTRRR